MGRLEQLFRRSGLFRWPLARHERAIINGGLQDNWRGNAADGSVFLSAAHADSVQTQSFHNFNWLRDLRARGGNDARTAARRLIEAWLDKNHNWHPEYWQPDVMGTRLSNLLFCYGWYGVSATEEFQNKLAASVARQAHCLVLDWRRLNSKDSQITALKGLAVAEAALGCSQDEMQALLDIAIPRIEAQIFDDGGHKSRMPETHFYMLRDLIEFRSASAFAGLGEDKTLDHIIGKMGAICRMWRHGNGSFTHMNGAGIVAAELIDETLARAGSRGKVLQHAPYSGFMRFSSGRSTIIMDIGAPCDEANITGFGTLGFEFSFGSNLLIVNPGQPPIGENLHRLLCSTSAHSTLSLDGQNSSSFGDNRIASTSDIEFGQVDGGLMTTASHSGYEKSHGIVHQRTLYLATNGGNLRGADRLEYTGAPGELPRQAIIRFHLHPKVSAAILGNGRVLMKIRGNRIGWIFKAGQCNVSIDTSIYFDAGMRQSAQQIVLTAPMTNIRSVGSQHIKWAFQRNDTV
ncbi:heparinase II/III family protein [Candidatus Puniceispirillum sp.]|uniref:heparinase II/III family protein n=1 Tax=Candidatus Puniceispirillum sp. TaxID=2026719 RepID=UPI003F6A3B2D